MPKYQLEAAKNDKTLARWKKVVNRWLETAKDDKRLAKVSLKWHKAC